MPNIPNPPLIGLLTDMGHTDWYVGTMKGVMLGICPHAQLVDICHDMTPQSAREGAFVLDVSHKFFPNGTIFLCVIDPDVGSAREQIVARNERHFFVAPNNGLLTSIVDISTEWEVRVIENPAFRLPETSRTFHGRDVFAPAAAHLAAGAPFEEFGPPLGNFVRAKQETGVTANESSLSGRITYIDTYGNLLTNVKAGMLPADIDPARLLLRFKKRTVRGITSHFSAVPLNHPLMYWGSSDLLEIAFNRGSAARKWSVHIGEWFELEW
jgi:S-adenosylmethionine hydrolase